jgi:8-oxo-dGTP diphosphatase
VKTEAVAVAFIEREGRVFLQRRAADSRRFPALWELPGGKVEPGETPREALERELLEELAWRPEQAECLVSLEYAYADGPVALHAFRCPLAAPAVLRTDLAWGWFRWHEVLALPLPEATRSLVLRRLGLDPAPPQASFDPGGAGLT